MAALLSFRRLAPSPGYGRAVATIRAVRGGERGQNWVAQGRGFLLEEGGKKPSSRSYSDCCATIAPAGCILWRAGATFPSGHFQPSPSFP